MDAGALLLIGLVVILAWLSHRAPQARQLLWLQQWKGWQKIFCLAGFIGAMLIVLNPEFLAFGFLGDAAFFDLLVFSLSLQFQTVAVRVLQWLRDASVAALSFMYYRLERDWIMIVVTLGLFADWARNNVRRISCAMA